MPFGSKNTPAFYTTIVKFLCYECILLFQETEHTIVMANSYPHIVCDDCIIDDILLFSNHISTILHYFLALNDPLLGIDFPSN